MSAPHSLGIDGMHHVSLRVLDLDKSLAFYRDTLGLSVRAAFTLNDQRFVMLELGNRSYLELVEVKRPVTPGGEAEVIWHFALRTDALEKAFASATQAGCEIYLPLQSLDLVNDVNGQPFPVRVAFFRGPDGEIVELLEDMSGQT